MSAAFDAVSAVQTIGATASSPNTNSWTHTPVGTPACVTLNIQWFEDIISIGNISITGITYGGQAMTQIATRVVGTGRIEKWIIHNPPAGAQTVALTWQNDDGVSTSQARYVSTSFTSGGTTSNGSVVSAGGTTSPMTASVTGQSANNVLDTVYGISDAALAFATVTVNGTNETKRSGTTNFGGVNVRSQHTTSTQTSANATVTPNATQSANRTWGLLSVEIREVLGTNTSSTRMLSKVGP